MSVLDPNFCSIIHAVSLETDLGVVIAELPECVRHATWQDHEVGLQVPRTPSAGRHTLCATTHVPNACTGLGWREMRHWKVGFTKGTDRTQHTMTSLISGGLEHGTGRHEVLDVLRQHLHDEVKKTSTTTTKPQWHTTARLQHTHACHHTYVHHMNACYDIQHTDSTECMHATHVHYVCMAQLTWFSDLSLPFSSLTVSTRLVSSATCHVMS